MIASGLSIPEASRQGSESNIVRFGWQTRDTNSRMSLVSDIEPDQHCSDLLDNAGIFQLAAVERTHPRNFSCQLADSLSGLLIIAAHDHVAIDWAVLVQQFRRNTVKRG